MIRNAKRNDPRDILHELKAASHMVIGRKDPDRKDEGDKDGDDGDAPDQGRFIRRHEANKPKSKQGQQENPREIRGQHIF